MTREEGGFAALLCCFAGLIQKTKKVKKGIDKEGRGWYSKQAVRDAALRLLEIGRDWKKVLDKADERW